LDVRLCPQGQQRWHRTGVGVIAMAGLQAHTPVPTDIVLHTTSKVLEIAFDNGNNFRLPYELLRVYSPSAEVQGHGPGQEVLQTGKRHVGILSLEPVGNYGVQPHFSDGHNSGIFSWDYLHQLGLNEQALWVQYQQRLQDAGVDRDAPMTERGGSACHS
jgi:DUF971 family protein